MPVQFSNQLSPRRCQTVRRPGMYADGGNLYLQVSERRDGGVAKSWILRYRFGGKTGKTRDMGLGSYETLGLSDAREAARQARLLLAGGIDPIEHRKAARQQAAAESAKGMTFRECAKAYIKAHTPSWRAHKHVVAWTMTLLGELPDGRRARANYCAMLHPVAIGAIDTDLVMKVLRPLWETRTETASRLRGRIESVLNYATTLGLRSGPNPAAWRGHLANLLPARRKVQRVQHHAALPWRGVGTFMQRLRTNASIGARALEFLVLTAARSGEVRGMVWSEVDLEHTLWTIPSERMKAGREHRVPLSGRAVEILREMARLRSGDLVFPGQRGRLNDQTLRMALIAAGGTGVVHGLRSAFRDWAGESTSYPNHVVEMALAHAVGNAVEASYRRGDLFEKRQRLMADWASYCAAPQLAGKVLPIRRRR